MSQLSPRSLDILNDLTALRTHDAPTHGGKVLSYVYDTGIAEIDELAAAAAREVQSINGLDPTVFPSIAMMESELLGFARDMLHGDNEVFGNVTSGGTESSLLAVKTARDLWRAQHRDRGPYAVPKLVAPTTVHAATHKAAAYFDLELVLVPVDPETGAVDAQDVLDVLDDDVALVVLSAPNYPYAQIDPIDRIAPIAHARGIAVHVDACIGGFALPWWKGLGIQWDFAVTGVTSIAADLHKYGYAPKGASVLMHRGLDRHRAQYFALIGWPGYPVVNPTMLGSKSAAPVASAWAITKFLGAQGYAQLTERTQNATQELLRGFNEIVGLRVQGEPAGPLLAVVADDSVAAADRVDPHLLVDEMRASGWILQSQPGCVQPDGTVLPHSAHLTITPVIDGQTGALLKAANRAAECVRGLSGASADLRTAGIAAALTAKLAEFGVDAQGVGAQFMPALAVQDILADLGVDTQTGVLPNDMSGLLAIAQRLPNAVAQRLLTEILAILVTPS